jgi:hypothetical protein
MYLYCHVAVTFNWLAAAVGGKQLFVRGIDNITTCHNWKNYEKITGRHHFLSSIYSLMLYFCKYTFF